jgi:hypothetical protein
VTLALIIIQSEFATTLNTDLKLTRYPRGPNPPVFQVFLSLKTFSCCRFSEAIFSPFGLATDPATNLQHGYWQEAPYPTPQINKKYRLKKEDLRKIMLCLVNKPTAPTPRPHYKPPFYGL